jgi:hypothetical protein
MALASSRSDARLRAPLTGAGTTGHFPVGREEACLRSPSPAPWFLPAPFVPLPVLPMLPRIVCLCEHCHRS